MDNKKQLSGEKIISLLQELDALVNEPCRIIICGGASAIIAHGLNRLTGDIDTFEPVPKSNDFYNQLKKIQENHGLDPAWFNEGAKVYSDCLSPKYKKRLVSIKFDFKNLTVFAISKADLITMKLCAWRESDIDDINKLNITEQDMVIINENISFMKNHRPDDKEKALRALAELGKVKVKPLTADNVSNLAELIQFYKERTGKEASIEDIKKWRDASDGQFSILAQEIIKNKDTNHDMGI